MAIRRQLARRTCRPPRYGRQHSLILVNGLAEQPETWFRNHRVWRRYFDVSMPNLLAYDGPVLHRRIEAGLPITVDFLVEQLHRHLEEFIQRPPYYLVANSMGGKIAVEYAVRYPDRVSAMVLICPSGLSAGEELPIVDGVRHYGIRTMIESIFFDPRHIEPALVEFYQGQTRNRRWRTGLMHTIRGTKDHCVRDRLAEVKQPTLLVGGREDRIVNLEEARAAAGMLPRGRFVNRLVVHYLTRQGTAPSREERGSGSGQTGA
jgi:pimeloyl-ACP methyl ester carboxylesterase